MNTNVGIWSPNDLILPTVEADLDYKFFFVTESGSIDGLNISFNAGDWLVYIKKDGEGNWYKTNGGIVSFNMSSSANAPDPGFYTKVRLDQNGNIIDASYLNSDDLPKHTHDIETISGDWANKIKGYIGEMFQSHSDSSVQFTYDKVTQTISAEVNIDGDTITKDEWGELVANGVGGSGGTADKFTGTIKIEQVQYLKDNLLALDSNIRKNFLVCNANSGLALKRAEEAAYLSVKIDGTSLVLNSDGELSVAPGVLGGGAVDGSDLSCGAHTHTSSQITDFEEAVLALVKDNVKFQVNEIPIDGETIIINSNGQLACVAAGTRAHTHVMKDITDLNPNIANVWASKQGLQPDEDYSKGAIPLEGQTIGYAVRTINEYLKDIDTRISKIETKVNSIDVPEPNGIDFSNFVVTYSGERNVIDKDNFKSILAGKEAIFESDYFYPATRGTLSVFIDDKQVYSVTMDDSTGLYVDKNFQILGIRDSYYDNSMYRGTFDSMKFKYIATDLMEGYHTIFFRHTYHGETHNSKVMNFQIYMESIPYISVSSLTLPQNNSYVSGIPCYKGEGKIQFTPRVDGAFTRQFINDVVYQYSIDNGTTWVTPDILSTNNRYIFFNPITIFAPKNSTGAMKVLERAYNVVGDSVDSLLNTPSLVWNNTDIEQYRVKHSHELDDQAPSKEGVYPLIDYDSKERIHNHEMVIRNNIGSLVKVNYKNVNGPDYENQTADSKGFVWCNFRFPAPFMNNLHVDVVHQDGTPFNVLKNGMLEDVQIFVCQSSSDVSSVWVNGNAHYPGYGSANSINSPGLDLFKSNPKTRYITFGQRPDIDVGYLYVKVGVKSNIDLGVFVESIKESINEWS